MPSKKDVVILLEEIADMMEFQGENPLKLMLIKMAQTL